MMGSKIKLYTSILRCHHGYRSLLNSEPVKRKLVKEMMTNVANKECEIQRAVNEKKKMWINSFIQGA